jgi:hypothetical protein
MFGSMNTTNPTVINGQGTFILKNNQSGFVPGTFALNKNGILYWNMREPYGCLIQYPTTSPNEKPAKRFVKDQLFWDIIDLTREEVSQIRHTEN